LRYHNRSSITHSIVRELEISDDKRVDALGFHD
jgi:hypothetical protein